MRFSPVAVRPVTCFSRCWSPALILSLSALTLAMGGCGKTVSSFSSGGSNPPAGPAGSPAVGQVAPAAVGGPSADEPSAELAEAPETRIEAVDVPAIIRKDGRDFPTIAVTPNQDPGALSSGGSPRFAVAPVSPDVLKAVKPTFDLPMPPANLEELIAEGKAKDEPVVTYKENPETAKPTPRELTEAEKRRAAAPPVPTCLEPESEATKGRISIVINKSDKGEDQQNLRVYLDGKMIGAEKISTGRENMRERAPDGKVYSTTTPVGTYRPWYRSRLQPSSQWKIDLENAIFFNNGIALHAVPKDREPMIGLRDSAGCVRVPAELEREIYDQIEKLPLELVKKLNPKTGKPMISAKTGRPIMTRARDVVITVKDRELHCPK